MSCRVSSGLELLEDSSGGGNAPIFRELREETPYVAKYKSDNQDSDVILNSDSLLGKVSVLIRS